MLILQNVVVDIYSINEGKASDSTLWNNCVKKHILNNFDSLLSVIEEKEIYFNVIFLNITENDMNILSDKIINGILNNEIESQIIERKIICENKKILSAITMESVRHILSSYESDNKLKKYSSLYETSKEKDFDIKVFLNGMNNLPEYVTALIDCHIFESNDDKTKLKVEQIFKLLSIIPVQYLNENVQNFVMFTILVVQMSLVKVKNLNKSLKRVRSNCNSILLKTFDLSFKLPKVFNVFPLELFIKLIESDYFTLMSSSEERNDMFNLLRQILLASVNKENIDVLDQLVVLISRGCESEDVLDVVDNKIQTLFLLFITLSSIKKSNLAAELKEPVSKLQSSIACNLRAYFNNIKWKRLQKKILVKNDADSTIELDKQEINAFLNSLGSYSMVLSEEISKPSDKESLKKISKALNFFIEICVSIKYVYFT